MKKMILASVLLVIAAGLSACAVSGEAENAQNPVEETAYTDGIISPGNETEPGGAAGNTITVSSSEQVSVAPDIAEVVYSVKTERSGAAECQQKNAEDVAQVIELLESLGVQESSIQTSDYYMNPVYDYSGNRQRLTGYEAITTLTVTNLLIESLDEILAGSVQSGVNTVRSITYKASRYDESYEEALQRAVASAYRKAKVLAEASGASVGKAVRIEEISGYSEARYTDYARSGMANSYAAMKEAALEDTAGFLAGEIQVEARISVEYELIN